MVFDRPLNTLVLTRVSGLRRPNQKGLFEFRRYLSVSGRVALGGQTKIVTGEMKQNDLYIERNYGKGEKNRITAKVYLYIFYCPIG